MKNFFIAFVLILLLACLAQVFLPWWSMAIVPFIIGYSLEQKAYMAFLSGFVAVFLLWGAYAFLLSSANEHLLAGKVAQLMQALTGGHTAVLFLLTGLLGGITAGLAAFTGHLAARLQG